MVDMLVILRFDHIKKDTCCVARSPKSSACLCPHPWSSTFPMSRPGNSVIMEVDES